MQVGLTIHLVAADLGVCGISSVLGRAGAERLVVENAADGFLGAEGEAAGIQALFGSDDGIFDAGQLFGTLAVPGALIRFPAAPGRVFQHVGRTFALVRSWRVGARLGRTANIVLTLVDIQAALWGGNESLLASTLSTCATFLPLLTVGTYPAAWMAKLVDTNFSQQTVFVRMAELEADSVRALLAASTLPVALALFHAIAVVALGFITRAGVARLSAWSGYSDTALQRGWHSGKSCRTLADKLCFGALFLAYGVGAAGYIACVLAPVTHTNKFVALALMVRGAARDADTPTTSLAGKALGVSSTSDLALTLRTDFAPLLILASNLGARVGYKRRWTLAGVFVVFCQTDCIFSTDVRLMTSIHARVGKAVAILVGCAVVVLEAVYLLAASLVGVAFVKPVRTNALSNVVSGHTHSSGATAQEFTGWLAGSAPLARPADLILQTLGIIFALIGKCGRATGATFRVACVALFAPAVASVLLCNALGSCWTGDSLAYFDTSFDTVQFLATDLVCGAVLVALAVVCDLTGSRQLILCIAFQTLADGPTRIAEALLVFRTGHDLARVQAGPPSVDIDLAHHALLAVLVCLAGRFS